MGENVLFSCQFLIWQLRECEINEVGEIVLSRGKEDSESQMENRGTLERKMCERREENQTAGRQESRRGMCAGGRRDLEKDGK